MFLGRVRNIRPTETPDGVFWEVPQAGLPQGEGSPPGGEDYQVGLNRPDGSVVAWIVPVDYRDHVVRRMFPGLDMTGHMLVGAVAGAAVGALGVWALKRR
jgi:hypothetical protein